MSKKRFFRARNVIILATFAALCLLAAAVAIARGLPSGFRAVVAEKSKSPFDAKRAYGDLERIVAMGPRPSGSETIETLRTFIRGELSGAGLEVREEAFDAKTPIGELRMANIVGVVQGTRPGVIVLGNHYDTKYFTKFKFVGANDGGSTTAWMLEMARALGPRREGRTVWLCFFDGEEAFKRWSEADSLYGSRAFVSRLKEEGRLSEIQAMINVDMIGDCYLGIQRDPGAPKWLTEAVWGTAHDLGYGRHFEAFGMGVKDDHVPFRRAGVATLEVIDFTYGPTAADHGLTWHTANDTLDKVCAGSLQVAGDVIYDALGKVDACLDAGVRD